MSSEPIEIEKLDISPRLKKILRYAEFSDLRELSKLSKESILRIRNMGINAFAELQEQCSKYGVVIYSEKNLIDRSRGITWSWHQRLELFEMGIRTLEDIKEFPIEEIEKIKFTVPTVYGRLKHAKRKLGEEP